MNDAIRPEAIEPLSADEEMRLRAEAESEKDHENKRHARWQRLVLRLLATLDAARRQRDEIEAEAADQINGIRAERAARVPVSEEGGYWDGGGKHHPAVPVSPEGLDVERLARALRAFWPVIFREDDVVADVAAEYAARAERGTE